MHEGAPKEMTEKEVFKTLRRKLGPYINLAPGFDEASKTSITNTMAAYNLISEYVDNGEEIPNNWTDLNFDTRTKFTFVKERDGQLTREDAMYISPITFIKALRKYHGLLDLVSLEEKNKIEADKARRNADRTKLEEDARSGALWRNRMPQPMDNNEVPIVKPVRPSAFRPRG